MTNLSASKSGLRSGNLLSFPKKGSDSPAFYNLKDTAGTLLDSGEIVSGDTKDIEAPDSRWTLKDTGVGTLGTGTILSGGSADIVAPNAEFVLRDTSQNELSSGAIPSGTSADIEAPDSSWDLTDQNSVPIQSGTIPSGMNTGIIAPPAGYIISSEQGDHEADGIQSNSTKEIFIHNYPKPLYGFLYNWYTAVDSKGLTSSDTWRVPTKTDVETLCAYLEYEYQANPYGWIYLNGGKLKSTETYPDPEPYWNSPNTGAENAFNFDARAGGRRVQSGSYSAFHEVSSIMLSSVDGSSNHCVYIYYNESYLFITGALKYFGLSVRLIREATEEELLLTDGDSASNYVGNDARQYLTVKIGTQIWTVENLCETLLRDGTPIPLITDNTGWINSTTAAYCYANGELYKSYYRHIGASSEVVISDSEGTVIYENEDLLPGSRLETTAPDADWTLKDTAGGTLDSGSIVSGGADDIEAPDAMLYISYDSGEPTNTYFLLSGSILEINIEEDNRCIEYEYENYGNTF